MQILPVFGRNTSADDVDVGHDGNIWNFTVLFLEKLFTQSEHDAAYFNDLDDADEFDVVQMALHLLEQRSYIPPDVMTMYNHWRIKQTAISFQSWPTETQEHEFERLTAHFCDFGENQMKMSKIKSTFPNLKNYTDFSGRSHYVEQSVSQSVSVDLQPVGAVKEGRNAVEVQTEEGKSWQCRSCWFKNGKQRVNGVLVRLCDARKCGLCGASREHQVAKPDDQADVRSDGPLYDIDLRDLVEAHSLCKYLHRFPLYKAADSPPNAIDIAVCLKLSATTYQMQLNGQFFLDSFTRKDFDHLMTLSLSPEFTDYDYDWIWAMLSKAIAYSNTSAADSTEVRNSTGLANLSSKSILVD